MVTQSLLWQSQQQSPDFAELCNALYERELRVLASNMTTSFTGLQGRVKSLPHYVKRAAHALLNADCPLELDVQNASWSAKQMTNMPSISQRSDYQENVLNWYKGLHLTHGLVLPISEENRIVLDCIDRIDIQKQRLHMNVYGWFSLTKLTVTQVRPSICLLKPTKKIMTAACAGHCWQNSRKAQPLIPSLRELLLSCNINWRNFKQPVATNH